MTPARLGECLKRLRWSPATLAEALECDEALVEAWVLGLEDIQQRALSGSMCWPEPMPRRRRKSRPL